MFCLLIGLCHQNVNKTSGDEFPPPTPEDLQGFWDMVMLQVVNIDTMFQEVDAMRQNNWKVNHSQ